MHIFPCRQYVFSLSSPDQCLTAAKLSEIDAGGQTEHIPPPPRDQSILFPTAAKRDAVLKTNSLPIRGSTPWEGSLSELVYLQEGGDVLLPEAAPLSTAVSPGNRPNKRRSLGKQLIEYNFLGPSPKNG